MIIWNSRITLTRVKFYFLGLFIALLSSLFLFAILQVSKEHPCEHLRDHAFFTPAQFQSLMLP